MVCISRRPTDTKKKERERECHMLAATRKAVAGLDEEREDVFGDVDSSSLHIGFRFAEKDREKRRETKFHAPECLERKG